MNSRVGVDVRFPCKGGQPIPLSVIINGVVHKVEHSKVKNMVYHVVLENNRQALLSWDIGTSEWVMRDSE